LVGYGLFSSEVCFFHVGYCVIQSTGDRAPWSRSYLYARMRLRLWLPKVRMVNQFMLATFSKSVILLRHVVRFWVWE